MRFNSQLYKSLNWAPKALIFFSVRFEFVCVLVFVDCLSARDLTDTAINWQSRGAIYSHRSDGLKLEGEKVWLWSKLSSLCILMYEMHSYANVPCVKI